MKTLITKTGQFFFQELQVKTRKSSRTKNIVNPINNRCYMNFKHVIKSHVVILHWSIVQQKIANKIWDKIVRKIFFQLWHEIDCFKIIKFMWKMMLKQKTLQHKMIIKECKFANLLLKSIQ